MLRTFLICCLAGQLGLQAQRYPFEPYGESELRSAPRSLLQDRTGSLWVASESQLFRFDGYRLSAYPLRGDVTEISEDPDGIVTGAGPGGVQRLTAPAATLSPIGFTRLRTPGGGVMISQNRDGIWVKRGAADFVKTPVLGNGALLAVAAGALWTQCGEALCATPLNALASGRDMPERWDGLPRETWIDLAAAPDGTLWLLGRRTLMRRPPGASVFEKEEFPAPENAEPTRLAINSLGEPVFAAGQKIWWKRQQHWLAIGAKEGLGGRAQTLYFDREDSLWAGTSRGLFRLLGEGRWQYWNERNGLQPYHLMGLARDAGGTLWIGGKEQVVALRDGVLTTPAQLGPVADVRQAADGAVWFALEQGVARWANGALETFASPPARSLAKAGPIMWAATRGGLWRSSDRTLVTCPLVTSQEMREVHADPQGNIWASNPAGLLRFDGAKWQRYGKADGLLDDNVGPFTVDDRGWIWLGYLHSKVITWAEWSAARRQTVHYDKAPLPGPPAFLRHDRQGRIWIGTVQGVSVTDGEKWARFRQGDGLVDDDVAANGFLEDPDGTIWLATARGLARFTPPENLFMPTGRAPTIMLAVEGSTVPPARIGPENRSITFQFGTSAFVDPFSVRYRYRLLGFDDDWQMGQPNFVRYPNLPPGAYTFEAQAQSAAGVLSAAPSRIAFRVLPPWWLTWWFRGVVLAAAASIGAWLWKWRLRLAESANQRRVDEMMDQYPGPVCIVDRDGRFRTVNQEFTRVAALPRSALIGRMPAEVNLPFIQDQLAGALAEGRGTTSVSVFEPSIDTARGPLDLDARVFALKDRRGRADSVCFVGTDVTERRRAERERDRAEHSLRSSEQRYRVFLENSQEGMLRIEFTPPIPTDLPADEIVRLFYERGQMAECNDAHARLRGFTSAHELIGQRGTALRDPELHREQDLAFVKHAFRLGGLPGVLKSVTGELRHVLYNAAGIVENGKLARIWGTTQDITEAKRLEEALRALSARQATAVEDERSRISREIHDELGQQLTALKMDLTMLQRAPSRERLDELIQHIDAAVQTVRRIATELRPAILDHFGLAAAVEWQTVEFTKRSGLAHTVDVPEQIQVPRDLAITIFRILQEALTNVARHAQAEHVEVILKETRGELVLRVVDDGRGLPERKGERPSLGILGMRERASAFGGTLTLKPARPHGVEVEARFRLDRRVAGPAGGRVADDTAGTARDGGTDSDTDRTADRGMDRASDQGRDQGKDQGKDPV